MTAIAERLAASASRPQRSIFDYIVIGAGSAGCVLAARLSEDPEVTVCLIEAGPSDDTDSIRIPVAGGKLPRTRYDWDYDSMNERFCDDRRLYLPRGRVLGGTSSLNGMVHIRGNQLDYDGWQQPGWSYQQLLPYFLRSEDNERGPGELRGVGGPLSVSDNRSRNPMSSAFIEAATQAGYQPNDDFNSGQQDGFGYYQVTQRDGRRANTSTSYLYPALQRPNLTVQTYLQVQRIVVANGRASGVSCRRLAEEFELHAEREVIVSAGSYNSPQLLMLSGIGPAGALTGLGIPVVHDLSGVGRNLSDHPALYLVFQHSQPISLLAAGTDEDVREFIEHGRGPLTCNVPEAGGFVRTSSELPAPDVQFHSLPVMFVDNALGVPPGHGISFGPCVLAPASRGEVSLMSDDPSAKPRIRHNYYQDPADLDTMVAGLRVALEIARQPALKLYTESRFSYPAAESEDDLRAFIRANTQSIYHPAGTCAMGSVVDHELRVQGIDGLRVADASVMPSVPRGNTNAPTVAIAEKAADLIRGRAS